MEVIDGWGVDERQGFAKKGPVTVGAPDADYQYLTVDIAGHGMAPVDIPVPVVRALLGECDSETREIRGEMLAAVALLTGTRLEPCGPGCPGHLSKEAHAQIRAAQSGWTAEVTLPWRPAVGERCYLFAGGEWRLVERETDEWNGGQRFWSLTASHATVTWFEHEDYDGIRPLGSLPVPPSVRTKAQSIAEPDNDSPPRLSGSRLANRALFGGDRG